MSRTPSRLHARRLVVTAALTALTSALPLTHAEAAVLPIPTGNLPQWTQTFRDDFHGALNPAWGAYTGQPTPYSWWEPDHVEMRGGQAWLRGYREGTRWVTAGMMLNGLPQRYGKYLVRAKFGKGAGIEHVMMLWPTNGVWPPEVDFSEGESDGETMATAHWGVDDQQSHRFVKVDMTQWHTYGVEWTPTRLTLTLDGRRWGSFTGAAVPQQRMSLVLQTAASQPVGPISKAQPHTVYLAVDWVSVYRMR